jgi:hypothetical protein
MLKKVVFSNGEEINDRANRDPFPSYVVLLLY